MDLQRPRSVRYVICMTIHTKSVCTLLRGAFLMAACTAFLLLACAGCEDAEAAAIRAMLVKYDQANEQGNGLLAKECVTKSSDTHYDTLRKHALYSDEKTVRALSPSTKLAVIMIRNRASAEQLEVLTGEDFLVWSTNQGWYAGGEPWANSFGRIKVDGDVALAPMLDEGKPTRVTARFKKEEGKWRLDETTLIHAWDEHYIATARAEGMSVDELITYIEEEDSGKYVEETVWQPMVRRN